MIEPIVLRDDVPMLERLLALSFVAVGGSLTALAWTEPDEPPELLVPIIQVGLPLLLIVLVRWAFVQRHRLVVGPMRLLRRSMSGCSSPRSTGRLQ